MRLTPGDRGYALSAMLLLAAAASILWQSAPAFTSPAAPAPVPLEVDIPGYDGRRPTPREITAPPPTPAARDSVVSPPVAAPERNLLAAAQARLRRLPTGPASEVDRWAIRLASERTGSSAALRRYGQYRMMIEEALRRRQLPLDLAFLPWVESEWTNVGPNRVGAAGMWQLMPATARGYGLEISAYIDERRDPVRSTLAAVHHLADLRDETNDWHTALAAYNAGIGRTGRSRGAFWRRRRFLPAETRAYVPHVLAAARVGRSPEAWGLPAIAVRPYRFRVLWTQGGTPLASVAQRVGVSVNEIAELNPHLIRGTTPPGRCWPVRVPVTGAALGNQRRR